MNSQELMKNNFIMFRNLSSTEFLLFNKTNYHRSYTWNRREWSTAFPVIFFSFILLFFSLTFSPFTQNVTLNAVEYGSKLSIAAPGRSSRWCNRCKYLSPMLGPTFFTSSWCNRLMVFLIETTCYNLMKLLFYRYLGQVL